MKSRIRHAVAIVALLLVGFPVPVAAETFSWFTGPWSECSEICGGGSQFREVICVQIPGELPVEDVFCSADPKPATIQACNTEPCEIFADDFESGDTRRWSLALPP